MKAFPTINPLATSGLVENGLLTPNPKIYLWPYLDFYSHVKNQKTIILHYVSLHFIHDINVHCIFFESFGEDNAGCKGTRGGRVSYGL